MKILIALALILVIIFLIVYFKLYTIFTPKYRLPVLMYHRIASDGDDLAVSAENLDRQFSYLSKRKYNSLFFKELPSFADKPIIITFDDGYLDNFIKLPPLLEKYDLKACIFIPTKFIQSGYGNHIMMNFEQIKSLNPHRIEVGLHSHEHKNFRALSSEDIRADLLKNMEILDLEKIAYTKVLAYPYGKFPKEKAAKSALFSVLNDLGIACAVRIGNKINSLPIRRKYEVCRIDIKNSDSLLKFKLKLIFGRLKIF